MQHGIMRCMNIEMDFMAEKYVLSCLLVSFFDHKSKFMQTTRTVLLYNAQIKEKCSKEIINTFDIYEHMMWTAKNIQNAITIYHIIRQLVWNQSENDYCHELNGTFEPHFDWTQNKKHGRISKSYQIALIAIQIQGN